MTRYPVTKKELIRRIRRDLKKKGERLLTSRGRQAIDERGEHYIEDFGANVLETHVDIVVLAREMELIGPFERLDLPATRCRS